MNAELLWALNTHTHTPPRLSLTHIHTPEHMKAVLFYRNTQSFMQLGEKLTHLALPSFFLQLKCIIMLAAFRNNLLSTTNNDISTKRVDFVQMTPVDVKKKIFRVFLFIFEFNSHASVALSGCSVFLLQHQHPQRPQTDVGLCCTLSV